MLHRKHRHELILLDLQMLGMDGFEVMAGFNEMVLTQELVPAPWACARGRHRGFRQAAQCRRDYYRRGHISVLDRAGLELRTCECYGVVKRELARLLSGAH